MDGEFVELCGDLGYCWLLWDDCGEYIMFVFQGQVDLSMVGLD